MGVFWLESGLLVLLIHLAFYDAIEKSLESSLLDLSIPR